MTSRSALPSISRSCGPSDDPRMETFGEEWRREEGGSREERLWDGGRKSLGEKGSREGEGGGGAFLSKRKGWIKKGGRGEGWGIVRVETWKRGRLHPDVMAGLDLPAQ